MQHSNFPHIQPAATATALADRWQGELQFFWRNMQSGVLTTSDNIALHYQMHLTPNARHAVVISAGRVEMAVKYAELSFELVEAGYSVFIADHRGQGLSQRQLKNPHKGFVRSFEDYQSDLAQFVNQIVLPAGHQYHIAIGHSMGCAILGGYLQQYQHPFHAAILASPMFGIYTGLVPASIAEPIALAVVRLNRLCSNTPWYFPGQSDYREKAFDANPLTGSKERYQWLQQLYREQPDSQLGGVTTDWIQAAIAAMHSIKKRALTWQTPVLLLQAAQDKVVSNFAQQQWFQRLPDKLYHHKEIIADAHHEMFMETDAIRAQVFQYINQFLAKLP